MGLYSVAWKSDLDSTQYMGHYFIAQKSDPVTPMQSSVYDI